MKKRLLFTTLILSILIALTSCMTTFSQQSVKLEYSEKEANEALYVVINKAIKNTNTRFFQKISTYSFLPKSYEVFSKESANIPGMNKLLSLWNNTVSTYMTDHREELANLTEDYAKKIEVTNGSILVEKSNISGIDFAEKSTNYGLKTIISNLLEDIDYSYLENAVNQYNAWIETQNYINKTNNAKVERINPKDELVDLVYNYYRSTVEMYEEISRTTPDPYAEDILIKVFGVN